MARGRRGRRHLAGPRHGAAGRSAQQQHRLDRGQRPAGACCSSMPGSRRAKPRWHPAALVFAGGAALRWTEAAWRAEGQRFDLITRARAARRGAAAGTAATGVRLGRRSDACSGASRCMRPSGSMSTWCWRARRATCASPTRPAHRSRWASASCSSRSRRTTACGASRKALAGRQLGEIAGAQTVRTNAQARWPPADAPLEGVLQMRVANLGAWGTWVPPGWRLGGNLQINAAHRRPLRCARTARRAARRRAVGAQRPAGREPHRGRAGGVARRIEWRARSACTFKSGDGACS